MKEPGNESYNFDYSELAYYRLISQFIQKENKDITQTFGIEVTNYNGNVICTINDISLSRGYVQSLVEKCNRLNLSKYHILEIVQDAISI